MFEGARVAVVIPAFQEESRVGRVVRTLPAFVDRAIVVDDASTDATAAEAARAGAEVVRHARNQGVGAAIASGYRAARGEDAIAVMAGDGQMHPDDLALVVAPVARGHADYVKGNRFAPPYRARSMPLGRKLGGAVFSRLTSLAIRQRIHDAQCGFTCIGPRALERVELYPRFGYPNDLLGQLAAQGLRILEVPVRPIYADEESKLRVWHLGQVAWLIARAAYRVHFRAVRPG